MKKRFKNIALIFILLFSQSVYADELIIDEAVIEIPVEETIIEEITETILEETIINEVIETQIESSYIKPIKINNINVDVIENIKEIQGVLYIKLNNIKYYSENYFLYENDDIENYKMNVNGNDVTFSLNSNYFYVTPGYIYCNTPKVIDDETYIPLEAFSFILGYEYGETDEYILIDDFKKGRDYSFTSNELIAHAMGGIDGIAITNSKESFLHNYEKGFRVFEVDLQYTVDAQLVAVHDFGNPYKHREFYRYDEILQSGIIRYEQFVNNVIFGAYTPMTFEDVVNLMKEYEDIYIITDTKYIEESNIVKQFNDMVETTKEVDESILDRFIPQLYSYEMYDIVENIYNFDAYIMTLYMMQNLEYDTLANFVYENGIGVVAMDAYTANENLLNKLNSLNIKSYVHTINDNNIMLEFLNRGVNGFYTDFMSPSIYNMIFDRV